MTESTALRMYRKALSKENEIAARLALAEEAVRPKVEALQGRIEKIRRRAITLESKLRDARTQRQIRFRKLNGGEVGHLAIGQVKP
jgi:predicted  nucleic acid-binding Zn-ribbon protein